MHITHIYADASGESHFEDVDVALSPRDFAPPAPPVHTSPPVSASVTLFAELPTGWLGDWHPAPRRQYWLGIAGTVEVTVSDGETRRFGPGSAVLLEDVTGKGHRTGVVGDEAVRAMFVQL